MSLYNLLHGMTPATFFVLPILGQHPDKYPRFRDCFLMDETCPEYNGMIHIYTRVGGNNREEYANQISALQSKNGYVTDYDDPYDSTYATFVFEIPPKWREDVDKFVRGELLETSQEYKDLIISTYPKLADKLQHAFKESGRT
jgi:hypothetical protein